MMDPAKFQLSIGSMTFELGKFSPEIDRAFILFYQAVIGGSQPDHADFDPVALSFFDSHELTPVLVDLYFTNFTPLWSHLVAEGRLATAFALWEWALRPAFAWELQQGRHLHKGTAFYFAGMTAILSRDLDGGYLLMHRALEEDIRTSGMESPETPAYALVVMDSIQTHQAFRDWVLAKAELVTMALDKYRREHQRSLDFMAFRSRFLTKPELREEVFLFSYSVARLLHFQHLPSTTLSSDFAGQLCANLLFDLALVVDASIRCKYPAKWKFVDLATRLSMNANLGLSKRHLRELNKSFHCDFEGTVEQILRKQLRLSDGVRPVGLSAALGLTYGCRNRGAHDVSAVRVIRERFTEISAALLETLFATIEVLH